MSTENTPEINPSEQETEGVFNIEKLFAKALSLESPKTPKVFFENIQPEIEIKFNLNTDQIQEFFYENTVTATITAKTDDKNTLFICEGSYSGIFRIENIDAKTTDILLNVTCPTIIFPYLRELIAETIVRAGFPPVYLSPVNFEAMYQQQLEQTGNA